jgi:DNA-binding IclR family transcriptional regulator
MMEENEKKILRALQKEPIGFTIEEASQKLNIHRITASKYLAILEVRGYISHKKIGKAKLFYLVKKP